MSGVKNTDKLLLIHSVTSADFIARNLLQFENFFFNVAGQLVGLSHIFRSPNCEPIFIIKLKDNRSTNESTCSTVNILVSVKGYSAWHRKLGQSLFSDVIFKNVCAVAVKYKFMTDPICLLKNLPETNWQECDCNLLKFVEHEDFLTSLDASNIQFPVSNCCVEYDEKSTDNLDIISYQGTISNVLDGDNGVYEMDEKIKLYLTYLLLEVKTTKLSKNDKIVLQNVHVHRLASQISFFCCGLSHVKVLPEIQEDELCLEFPSTNYVLCKIQRSSLNFSQTVWLLTCVSNLKQNLPALQFSYYCQSESNFQDTSNTVFESLFPLEVFGLVETQRIFSQSLVEEFCSFPHRCFLASPSKSFVPIVQFPSMRKLKERAIFRAKQEIGPSSSDWINYSLHSGQEKPKMILVGLLTSSAKDGKLKICDRTGKLECVVPSSRVNLKCSKTLEPHNLEQLVKITEFEVIVEQFRVNSCAPNELTTRGSPSASDVHYKVYLKFKREVIKYLHKIVKLGKVSSSKSEDKDSVAHKMSNLAISLPAKDSYKNQHCTLKHPNTKFSLTFQCVQKSPMLHNYKKGLTFDVHANIIDLESETSSSDEPSCDINLKTINGHPRDMETADSNKEIKNDNMDTPKGRLIILEFGGPAIKFFNLIYVDSILKISLTSNHYHQIISALKNSPSSIVVMSNVEDLQSLDCGFENKFDHKEPVCKNAQMALSVTDALSINSFKELITMVGTVAQRIHVIPQGRQSMPQSLYDDKLFMMGVGNWRNHTILLEMQDSSQETVNTRIFLDISKLQYHLGLVPGALVSVTSLHGHISKGNRIYFRSTVATRVEIITNVLPNLLPISMPSKSLLAEYMASEYLLLSEVLSTLETHSFYRYVCLVDIQHVWDVELKLRCPDCWETTTSGNICSYVGCHSQAPLTDVSTLSFSASDGSACINVKCNGDNARQILQISQDEWWTLLTSSGINKMCTNYVNKVLLSCNLWYKRFGESRGRSMTLTS